MTTPPPPPPPKAGAANPAFAAMGLPRLRAKLPSRNWSIFLTVCTTIGGTVAYDRYQTRLVKQKWINLVSHLAEQPLAPMALPRKVTVYLAAPPGDGIQVAREHFRDYVKPVLNAAAVDFDVVEGRKMGELRFKVAESIRGERRGDEDGPIEEVRKKIGVARVEEGGAVVVGRHAWKEYLRGVQEGWLGPLGSPPPPGLAEPVEGVEKLEGAIAEKPVELVDPKKLEEKEGSKKNAIPEPLLKAKDFRKASMPREMAATLEPAGVVSFPHILGFFNTPVRMYRYVTRRYMADEVCRQAAAVALGIHRPFITSEPASTLMEPEEVEGGVEAGEEVGEINALDVEERDWPGRVWKEDKYKGEWTEGLTLDPRIKSKLRTFFVPPNMEPKREAEAK